MSAAAITAGTNQPATWSARRWIGARLRCASATICTICASSVSRPILSARMTKLPVLLSVPPMTWAPASLRHRHGFAGDHRFVDRGAAFEHHAVDRHLLAGPHAQSVADRDGVERHFLVAAVVLHAARGLGREIEQRA